MTISLPCVTLEVRWLWGIFSSMRGLISVWQNHHSWMQKLLITLILAYLVIFPESCVMNLLCNWGHKGVSVHPSINQGLIFFELTISRTMTRLFSSFNRKQQQSTPFWKNPELSRTEPYSSLLISNWLLLKFRNVLFPKLWLREGHDLASVLFLILSWHCLDLHSGSMSMEFFFSVTCKGTTGTWDSVIVISAFFCNSIFFLSPKLFIKQWIFQYIRTCH